MVSQHVHQSLCAVELTWYLPGKKVESAVKQTISGKDVKASNTVLNPEALSFFKRFRDVEREGRPAKL
jgi:acetoacetyl-CoA synthetase